MINIQKELIAAERYARHGWNPTEHVLSKTAKARKENYENALIATRQLLDGWTAPEKVAETLGIGLSTAKKYLMVLEREGNAERKKVLRPGKCRWTYQYRKLG